MLVWVIRWSEHRPLMVNNTSGMSVEHTQYMYRSYVADVDGQFRYIARR